MAKQGRPSLYSKAIAERILERIAEGESIVQICRDDDMPGLRTVMRWAAEHEVFGTGYAQAREAQAEVMDDKILTAAEGANTDPQAARVKVEAYKWRAAKLAPKRYGDKLDLTSGNEPVKLDETAVAARIASLIKTGLERDG
jgi:hypothetical protein